MTISTQPRMPHALRWAAVRATLAPSAYRTEPWHLVLRADALEIHADRSRQLRALDPLGRQLTISCGGALLNARVALAAAGWDAVVERLPEQGEPDLLARVTLAPGTRDDVDLASLASIDALSPPAAAALVEAAHRHDVELSVVAGPEHLLLSGRLGHLSLLQQEGDPRCAAELRAWRTPSPAATPPHDQLLVVLGTTHDTTRDWLRTGEALQHVVLESHSTFGARPMTHVIENRSTREELRVGLDLDVHPQVLLQLGPPATTPPSRRRRLVDVLSIER